MTSEEAIENAARMLRFAEGETDLAKMERFIEIADGWKCIAAVINEQARI
jgi:hypothetical protein